MYAIAFTLQLFPLSLFLLGVWLLVQARRTPISLFFAAILLGFAWWLRPRLGKVPNRTFTRTEAPTLFAVFDLIRSSTGGRRLDRFCFDENAIRPGIERYGFLGRRVFRLPPIGAAVLSPLEIVGSLAHHQALTADRNLGHNRLVFATRRTLSELQSYFYFAAHEYRPKDLSLQTFADILRTTLTVGFGGSTVPPAFRLIALVLGYVFGSVNRFISRILWPERQRAVLQADLHAMRVVGTTCGVELMEKFEYWNEILQYGAGLCTRKEPNLYDELRAVFRTVPESASELCRI